MPLYEYACGEPGHVTQLRLGSAAPPETVKCGTCWRTAHRIWHPPAIGFKGPGFYTTEYGRRATNADD